MTGWIRTCATVGVTAGALALTACSGGSAGGSGTTPASQPGGTGAVNAPAGFRPAASGEIAEISGHTLQVQSSTEQTAVTYSAKTRFTAERATSLAAIKVGSCVVATAAASGTARSSSARDITATEVHVSAAQHGSCTGGRLAEGSRSFPAGARPTQLPGGAAVPSGAPSQFRRAGNGGPGAVAAGKVTAISGDTITVAETRPGSSTATTATVHVMSGTKYTTTVSTTARALKVGLCAVVNGSTDSSGSVAASRIALSPKTGGSCIARFTAGGPNG